MPNRSNNKLNSCSPHRLLRKKKKKTTTIRSISEAKTSRTKTNIRIPFLMSRLPLVVFGVILACIVLSFLLFDSVSYQGTVQPLPNAVQRIHNNPSSSPGSTSGTNRTTSSTTKFPKLIHYMWKSPQVSPPSETVRWQRGCKAVCERILIPLLDLVTPFLSFILSS